MKNKLIILVASLVIGIVIIGFAIYQKQSTIQDPITTSTSGMNIKDLYNLKGDLQSEKAILKFRLQTIESKIINDVDPKLTKLFNSGMVIQLPLN